MGKVSISDEVFKAYDIRGIYPAQINEALAEKVGEAFGRYIGSGKKVIVGFDARTSSPSLHKSLLTGLSRTGVKIINAGMVPTPVVFFGVMEYGLDGGVMVTASHNPAQWNGIKMYGKEGVSIGSGSGLEEIRSLCGKESLPEAKKAAEIDNIHDELLVAYKKFLLGKIKLERQLKVAIDPGTGSFSGIAREVFESCGAKVSAINDFPDGTFKARSPEPKDSTISQLKSLVLKEHADFGVAFDSDGDRAVFVDENGVTVSCDDSLSLFISHCLKKGDRAVYEVSCSKAVDDVIRKLGGVPIVSRTGRTFVLNEMQKQAAKIGGENSGHVYFSDIHMDDDALFAALKMAQIVSGSAKSMSELVSTIPKYHTTETQFEVDERYKFRTIDTLAENLGAKERNVLKIDGVKVIRQEEWFLLRASNTSPIIRLIAESGSEERTTQLVKEATEEFGKAYKQAQLNGQAKR